jgi:hypothetical protein
MPPDRDRVYLWDERIWGLAQQEIPRLLAQLEALMPPEDA